MKEESPRYIDKRVLTLVYFTIGFYLLAIVVVLSLLVLPFLFAYSGVRVPGFLLLACLGAAATILMSMIPPKDEFVVPGPLLQSDLHPRLFAEIEAIAIDMKQELPKEVYLIPQVNAWVTEYKGKRMMGVGLPLLSLLNRSQFKAILAHEFAHYHGGDTKLGHWAYNTREKIVRTIKRLASKGHKLTQMPFREYGELFLRVTQKTSREQETKADLLAAEYAGQDALISGLKTVSAGSIGFEYFWQNELAPVLQEGYMPPIIAGFREFMRLPSVEDMVSKSLQERLASEEEDIYDSHPPLNQRIYDIERRYIPKVELNQEPAIDLVDNVSKLEMEMLIGAARSIGLNKRPVPVSWDDTNRFVYLLKWTKTVTGFSAELSGIMPETFPALLENPIDLVRKIYVKGGGAIADDEIVKQVPYIIGSALAVALARQGWQVVTRLGSNIVLVKGEERLDPFNIIWDIVGKRLSADEWIALCKKIEIYGIDLGTVDKLVIAQHAGSPATSDGGGKSL